MITFSRIGTMGRFGNQLFQYAALKSLALTNNYEMCLPPTDTKIWHNQECLLKHLNIPEEFKEVKTGCTVEEASTYTDGFFQTPDNVDIAGYFQDVRYFEQHLPQIRKCVGLNANSNTFASAHHKFEAIAPSRKHSKVVSLHLRLGDNIFMSPQKDTCEAVMMGDPLKNYLDRAFEYFGNADYFVFAGGSRDVKEGQHDRDLTAAKQILAEYRYNFIFSSGNNTLEDFKLMELCDGSILSPFTTFGLWVGYLAKPVKSIVAPKDYFMGTEPDLLHRRLYLDNWIKM